AMIEAEFGLTNSKTVNIFLGEGTRNVTSMLDQVIERVVNGLHFGLMLALASIGISLTFATTGLSNFAHAEMVTFGSLMALVFGATLAVPLGVAQPLAVIMSALLGWLMDVGLWKPERLNGLSVVQLMIVRIGISLALRFSFQVFVGGGPPQ